MEVVSYELHRPFGVPAKMDEVGGCKRKDELTTFLASTKDDRRTSCGPFSIPPCISRLLSSSDSEIFLHQPVLDNQSSPVTDRSSISVREVIAEFLTATRLFVWLALLVVVFLQETDKEAPLRPTRPHPPAALASIISKRNILSELVTAQGDVAD